jgi:ribosomal protein L7Ae-like RNA K-turn-binding protein
MRRGCSILLFSWLVKGLREVAKAIEKHVAQICVLAEDCDQPDYVKLIKALCVEHNVHLVTVPSAETLGEWAGVSLLLPPKSPTCLYLIEAYKEIKFSK